MEGSMCVSDIMFYMPTLRHMVCIVSDVFLCLLRGTAHTFTITQQFMRGSGARTSGVAGEGCTM